MPTWSDCEGHGRVHEELKRLLASDEKTGDALFFASAGNTAQRHWSGPFRDGGDGHHVWKVEEREVRRDNVIFPWGRERVSVELCCPSESGFELIVSDLATAKVVGRSISKEVAGAASAVVAFVPEGKHEYQARVRRMRGTAGPFHLVVLGGRLGHASSPGSIAFPGDGSEVIAVGAVDASGRRYRTVHVARRSRGQNRISWRRFRFRVAGARVLSRVLPPPLHRSAPWLLCSGRAISTGTRRASGQRSRALPVPVPRTVPPGRPAAVCCVCNREHFVIARRQDACRTLGRVSSRSSDSPISGER